MLLLRRAARARGSACKRRQGKFPLTPLSARAILSRRIPAANASFTIPPLFPRTSRLHTTPSFRPTAVTIRPPTNRHRADRYADSASVRLVPVFQSPWKSCCACFPTLGRPQRIPSEPWTAFDKDRPSIGRLLNFSSLTPQDSARKTRRDLPPRARKPASYLPGVRKPAGLLSGATGAEKTPATFRVPFLCAVRSRPPVLHAGQP